MFYPFIFSSTIAIISLSAFCARACISLASATRASAVARSLRPAALIFTLRHAPITAERAASAPSGTGKSTHTQLWLQVFGDRAKILNDDKPAMRLENGVWYAYGTPWSGKYDYSVNTKVPLAGICILSRGDENRILPYGGAKAIHDILTQTIRSSDADAMIKLLELLDQLVTAVPVWKMECTPDPEAARVAYRAMSGKEK